jgi:ABC-2 type transport system ATP-binding protein
VHADGRVLEVGIRDDGTYDVVRDAVAAHGLGLVRMERRRHHIAEMFRPDREAAHAGS